MIDTILFDKIKKITPNAILPSPFSDQFNFSITKFSKGNVHAEVVVGEKWTNPFGIAHGGFLFTALDEALGTASCSVLADPMYKNIKFLSTTNHDIFFHSPAMPNDILLITPIATAV